jgi:hypothetical protein
MIHNCEKDSCLCHHETISKQQLTEFINNHHAEIQGILKIENANTAQVKQNQQLMVQLQQLTARLQKKDEETVQLKKCMDLKEKESAGSNSMYKGEYGEAKQELMLTNSFGKQYDIDGSKLMHKMDIRMIHKLHKYIIGVECKEKKILTATDMYKFHTDRMNNKYWAGIFISTQSPIKGFVLEKDTYLFSNTNSELYIYSNDPNIIAMVIGCFLQLMEQKFLKKAEPDQELSRKYTQSINQAIALYKKWNSMKKAHFDFDKQLLINLTQMGVPEETFNGHLYFAPKTKIKGNKHPYNII